MMGVTRVGIRDGYYYVVRQRGEYENRLSQMVVFPWRLRTYVRLSNRWLVNARARD